MRNILLRPSQRRRVCVRGTAGRETGQMSVVVVCFPSAPSVQDWLKHTFPVPSLTQCRIHRPQPPNKTQKRQLRRLISQFRLFSSELWEKNTYNNNNIIFFTIFFKLPYFVNADSADNVNVASKTPSCSCHVTLATVLVSVLLNHTHSHGESWLGFTAAIITRYKRLLIRSWHSFSFSGSQKRKDTLDSLAGKLTPWGIQSSVVLGVRNTEGEGVIRAVRGFIS